MTRKPLTNLNLNPGLRPDCASVDSMFLRHSHPSRMDAAGADYFEAFWCLPVFRG